jgi:manganese/zinc/iron transport system permease protein
MSIAMTLVGTICVVRKKSLSGEMLSHFSLPAVAIAYLLVGGLSFKNDFSFSILLLTIALIFCFAAQKLTNVLIKNRISEDAALCMMLSFGLGLGIFIQSFLQKSFPILFKKSQLFFYGQAATLLWEHVVLYAALAVLIALFIGLNHARLKWYLFDSNFFKAHGIQVRWIEFCIDLLITLAIIIGIRSCGVVLVSGMLIIPVVTARAFSNSLKNIYFLSIVFGSLSAILGNLLSFWIPDQLASLYEIHSSIALGPLMIVLSFGFCLFALLFSPTSGLFACLVKQYKNRFKVSKENALKKFWKHRDQEKFTFESILKILSMKKGSALFMVAYFLFNRILKKENAFFSITKKGLREMAYIVRIHRLFELYLTKELHVDLKNVHGIAEELEHVISEDIEGQISLLLDFPLHDPHQQPIPQERGEI